MARCICFFLLLALLTFMLPAAQAVAEKEIRVARVSLLKGQVKVAANGKDLRLYDSVMKGDTLEVPAGSVVRFIFYSDYHEEELQGLCTAKVRESGLSPSGTGNACRKTTREPYKSSLPPHVASRGKEIAGGVSKKIYINEAKYPLYPVANTLALPGRLTFSWLAPAAVKPAFYRVTFNRLDGDTEVKLHSAVVTTTMYTLPGQVTGIESGKTYIFGVEGFLRNPSELGAELPESRVAASSPPYVFTMPSREVVKFVGAQEKLTGKLTAGSDAWTSQAFFLFSLYLEYGADDRAAMLAKKLMARGKDNDLFGSNGHLRGLVESYAK